jgi:hypothetical protein
MSADNILIITQHQGKVRVYDVNFSDISSHSAWGFPVTSEKSEELTKYIVASDYDEIHKCDTVSQAEGFCTRYQRTNVVEYDHSSIVPEEKAKEIKKTKINKKKAKSGKKGITGL